MMPKKYASILIISLACASFSPSPYGASAEEIFTWQDCVRESLKNHPDLVSAQESVKQTEADKKITASDLFPQITGEVNASTSKTPPSSAKDTYSYGVSGTQLIFDGLKTPNKVKSASENIKAAQQNYKFTSSEVRLRLRTAFVALLKAQESLRIKEEIFNRRNLAFGRRNRHYEYYAGFGN